MKPLLVAALLAASLAGATAQTTDSTKARPVRPANPNDRRNGYETYQSTGQIVGSGPNGMLNTIDHRYEGLRGTPYFLPDWCKGQIEMTAGQNYTSVPLKFNAYQQQLVLLRTWAGNDSILVDAEQVKQFTLKTADGQTYVFKRYPTARQDDKMAENGYFLVLYEGKNVLLKRVAKTFRQADYKNPYANNVRYDEFRDASAYYLLKPDQKLTKVKLSRKSLLDALDDSSDALKAFAGKLDFKSEADAVALVRQHDSL